MANKVYTLNEIKSHNTKQDLWVVIHGKVYDITKYTRDHPGGADVLVDVAGTDATAAYEDVGHSEDADAILQTFCVGTVSDAGDYTRPKAVRVIQDTAENETRKGDAGSGWVGYTIGTGALGASVVYVVSRWGHIFTVPAILPSGILKGGFSTGFIAASLISTAIGTKLAKQLSKFTQIESGFTKYPASKPSSLVKHNPHLEEGFLDAKEYKSLPLIQKDTLAPNVYRFVFQLPNENDVIGLPIGQHVAIKATVDNQSISRSYTPTSNNLDRGRLELVIKCYPDGLLTGKYLSTLQIGEKVQFRGPKGAMKYHNGLCKRIGMIAGGTGITPMYQLIRAICEDDTDTTEISLIYANRTEEDILLRDELETFAKRYPHNVKIWYMLDQPSENWAYGKGYVTQAVMGEKLPGASADTKIMLCGPPGMVNAAKKGLVGLGFEASGSVSKMTDQIFCF
ncbi:hypothetical protein ASPWEDRAFT_114552 [Aspergillus wentii DTO 134E9]|uniref:Cytochrome-b5 reductase n=1 Tax=Aspergillus wentii DTO 134E9 TaxID=1073089 RepID=A0A1L9RDC1_ASPWE|nr:uncharacterized protein ASPWEDRAFT_114552 [Aspergillus wentii DTO 134E9]KAI9933195.1 hypothetical protein MW887_007667 [Aspergillus wentii]OJJ32921.1 hypothetical protein ASPWEDRAFT_114552 [Aspergillus wentii DTO 134E9]